ncbi:MAG: HlyD family efflux transporter periplasmic adaptor subunit [Dehalococcoidia bacterium]
MRRPLLLPSLVASIALAALAAAACTTIRVPWSAPAPLTASGTLEADETVISARVSGEIVALPVAAGSPVAKGDVVAQIDDRAVQLQIRQAPDPATRETYRLQAEDYTLQSPLTGVVTRMPVHLGELALPGQVLLAVGDLSMLKLTLYIRMADLDHVSVGQRLAITADPYPGRTFEGVVTSINQQAEFTPRNVQTQTDRLNLVFGVQATVANADGALKPGMPIDARFEASGGSQ